MFAAGTGTEEAQQATAQILEQDPSSSDGAGPATWGALEEHGGCSIKQRHQVSYITWHSRGDYFASVAPTGLLQQC